MKLIIANLKMNKNSIEMSEYLKNVSNETYNNEVVVLPSISNLFLSSIYNENISYGVQNFHYKEEGASTGEVNLTMLKHMNFKYALVGHQERRKEFKESNSLINKKLICALNNNLIPILCIGESSGQTKNNLYKVHLKRQLNLALKGVKVTDLNKIIIAYEPAFAIGAEVSADISYVENNIMLIKEILKAKSTKTEINPKIIYGGSVNLTNYKLFLNSELIDGLLIGRCILNADNLIEIGKYYE